MKKSLFPHVEVITQLALAQTLSYIQERRINLVFAQMQEVTGVQHINHVSTEHIALLYRHWKSQGSTPESLRKRVGYIRRVLKFAQAKGYIKVNPASFFRAPAMPSAEPVTLCDIEQHKLRTVKLPRELSKVRDLALMQICTGFAYVDLMAFRKEWLTTINGKRFIMAQRAKTAGTFIIPLLPEALEILERYQYRLPHYSNAYYNRLLKMVAGRAQIQTNLTTHVFRRTFGQNMLDTGLPMEAVSKMLGHKTIATTERYYARVKLKRMVRDVLHLAA